MPFCPKCRYEYRSGMEKCPDCDVSLQDHLPNPLPDSSNEQIDEMVPCWQSENAIEADTVRSMLDGNGIPCLIQESPRPIYLVDMMVTNYPRTYTILVNESRLAEAGQIIQVTLPK
jgi:hypothetical protein